MKLLSVILVAICMQAAARSTAQTITLSVKNVSLKTVFSEIRKQTNYNFFYEDSHVEKAKKVSIDVTDMALSKVLDLCLKGQPLSYSITGTTIIISRKSDPNSLGNLNDKQAQPNREIDVQGVVTNEEGVPLEAISVTVVGGTKGTFTNLKGEFLLRNVDEHARLRLSSVGYEPKIIQVNGNMQIKIELSVAVKGLDQTVIIGYGKTSQRFSTGSVTKITGEEIRNQPLVNPLAALQGRVPGLTVSPSSGLPGASINIQIRGQNSINPDPFQTIAPRENPLFIIDGVPFAPQNGNINQLRSVVAPGNSGLLNNSYGGISPFNNINPADIESIEVLRDADATAIYGSRGANGVIIITTKKAKSGKSKINLNVYSGASAIAKKRELLSTRQYLDMRREAYINDNRTPNANPNNEDFAPDLLIFDTTKYTDWQEHFVGGTANITNFNGSISGGSETTQFLVGAGYNRETYIFPGDFANKTGSVSLNLSHRSVNRKFFVNLSSNYSVNTNNTSASPNLLSAYSLPPNYPDLMDVNGNLVWTYKGYQLNGIRTSNNPLSYLLKEYNISNINFNNNFLIGYALLDNLILKTSFGYNAFSTEEYSLNPSKSNNPTRNIPASSDFGSTKLSTWIIEPQLEYFHNIGKSRLNVLVGATAQKTTNLSNSISAWGYINDALLKSVSAAPNKSVSDNYSEYKYSAVFGRIGYIHNGKYILNITARRDGSSRFGPGRQFGNFGSIGTGWLFSEESFIKNNISFISYGKLRSSYGTTGSDNAGGDYQYIPRWQAADYTYQGGLGYLPQNLFNPDFSWAVTKKFEAGIELGVFKDRILLSGTYYRNRSGNQLTASPLPMQTGFSTVTENWDALVQNSGLELQLNTTNIKTKAFIWTSALNLTIPKNKLISFPGLEDSYYWRTYLVGRPLSVIMGFQSAGVNDTTGIFQFFTKDKSLTYTPAEPFDRSYNDFAVIGSRDPQFYGGFRNTVSFKGFELDLFIEFKKQIGRNYLSQLYHSLLPGTQFNQPLDILDRWRKSGDKSQFPKFTTQTSTPAGTAAWLYFINSNATYSDASYIRLKNLSLAYNLPQRLTGKIKIDGVRIYLTGQNLFTITKYKLSDPETQGYYSIPPLRTIAGGLQLNF